MPGSSVAQADSVKETAALPLVRGLATGPEPNVSRLASPDESPYMAAFSGSAASSECVRAAAEVCIASGKDLYVAWVADVTWVVPCDQPIAIGVQALEHAQDCESKHLRVASALADKSCSWRFISAVGVPSVVLSEFAKQNNVSVVFVGPSGRMARWLGRCVPSALSQLCPGVKIVELRE